MSDPVKIALIGAMVALISAIQTIVMELIRRRQADTAREKTASAVVHKMEERGLANGLTSHKNGDHK